MMQGDIITTRVSKKNILLVEDEEALIRIIELVLNRNGYEVTVATRSKDALRLIEAMPDRFDLIITDLKMAEMNGLELGKMIKHIAPDIPIILSTGIISVGYQEKAEAGIVDTIQKPYTLIELTNVIAKHIGRQEMFN